MKPGPPASITIPAFPDVRRRYGQGFGCRRIVRPLENRQVFTTRSSIHRLLKGQPPYAGRRVSE